MYSSSTLTRSLFPSTTVEGIVSNCVASQPQYDGATSSLIATFQAERRKTGKDKQVVSALGMQKLSQKSLTVFCLHLTDQNCDKVQPLSERMSGKANVFAGTFSPQINQGSVS